MSENTKSGKLTGDDALVDDHFAGRVLDLPETEQRPTALTAHEREKSEASARHCIYVLLTSLRV